MKCRKCGDRAALELRRHNAAFCASHFVDFFRKQVAEAVHRHRMFTPEDAILVAVSRPATDEFSAAPPSETH